MPAEITMPQLSDTMSEGTLVKWLKKEGEKIKAGEVIAEVETDKATMEMESFESGTLAHIIAKEGDKVPVGKAIALVATGKESASDVKQQAGGAAPSAPAPAPPPKLGPSGPGAQSSTSAAASSSPLPKSVPPPAPSPHHGTTATLEGASRGEIHEPDDVGHGATREPATPVPPIPGGNGRGGERRVASPLARRVA